MRRAVVLWPLRPDFAAIKRRPLPPKWDSIACLVTSDTVLPLLSASCRNLASSSSGNFTVVLFMVCQHTLTRRVSRVVLSALR